MSSIMWAAAPGLLLRSFTWSKKTGDGTLTDYCFPESLWQEDLSGLLSVVSDGDRTYTVLGADLVDLTDEIQTQFPDLNPAMIEDAPKGGPIFSRATC